MPTILFLRGWRFFFYADERQIIFQHFDYIVEEWEKFRRGE